MFPIFLKTFSLLMCSDHSILNIFLYYHISVASTILFISAGHSLLNSSSAFFPLFLTISSYLLIFALIPEGIFHYSHARLDFCVIFSVTALPKQWNFCRPGCNNCKRILHSLSTLTWTNICIHIVLLNVNKNRNVFFLIGERNDKFFSKINEQWKENTGKKEVLNDMKKKHTWKYTKNKFLIVGLLF